MLDSSLDPGQDDVKSLTKEGNRGIFRVLGRKIALFFSNRDCGPTEKSVLTMWYALKRFPFLSETIGNLRKINTVFYYLF